MRKSINIHQLLWFVLAYIPIVSVAQNSIGIGTETPSSQAVVHLESTNRGLLIPRMTTGERDSISSPRNGLWIYDLTEKKFFYYNNREGWVAMEPVPSRLIVMWSGTEVPNGWALCDGTNSTPDLRDRFVVGYNASLPTIPTNNTTEKALNYGSIGNTGGEIEHTLTAAEIPSHTHGFSGGHTHTASIASTAHDHDVEVDNIALASSGADVNSDGVNFIAESSTTTSVNSTTENAEITISLSSDEATGIKLADTGGTPHNNLPPYYVLAFIMKI